MAKLLFSLGNVGVQTKTFKIGASTKLNMRSAVMCGTLVNTVVQTTNSIEQIGVIEPNDSYEASNGTTFYAAGSLVSVALRGPILNMLAGTTVSYGKFVELNSSGLLDGDVFITNGFSGTQAKFALSLGSATLNNSVDVVRVG